MAVRVKRVYDPPSPDDGYRVLVDRLWPRGLGKADARLDLWLRDVAPTTELRKWYGHEPERWPEFRDRYMSELAHHPDLVELLRDIAKQAGTLTLLFAAHDEERNEARVLAEVLQRKPAHSHH